MQRPVPEGWFRLIAARDVPCGAVRVARAFGGDLVIFRTRMGTLAVTDPHCPHLGAHLGHGGRVDGECLRCPFHDLGFSVDGRCHGSRADPAGRVRATLGTWPTAEWQEQVMVFHSASHSASRCAPGWTLPTLDDDGWSRPRWRTLRLAGHVQDVAENGVDLGHFSTIHGYRGVRDALLELDGARLHTRFAFERRLPLVPSASLGAVFDTDIWGLGCSITDLRATRLGAHFRLLLLATPVDAEHFDFTIGVRAARPAALDGAASSRLFDLACAGLLRALLVPVVSDVLQDRAIWRHRAWVERPALLPSDGGIATFRRWVRQFYPPDPARNERAEIADRPHDGRTAR